VDTKIKTPHIAFFKFVIATDADNRHPYRSKKRGEIFFGHTTMKNHQPRFVTDDTYWIMRKRESAYNRNNDQKN
jgi:hypothetical protein